MDKKKYKHILVEPDTHKRVKMMSSELEMSMDETIRYLLSNIGK